MYDIVKLSRELVIEFRGVKMNKEELSPSETLIMKVIWESGGEVSVSDLLEALKTRYNKEYARTTVLTFFVSMANKGFVDTQRKGKYSYVRALKTEEEYRQEIAKKTMKKWFGGSASTFLAALHNGGSLTPEEVGKAREYLEYLETLE